MKLPLISILMPTLNSERFLREAINSIVEQTYSNIELVVVDGGSTDSTLSILQEYADGGGMKIIQTPPGKGMGHDLNVGLDNCSGSFIARMDADDVAFNWRIDAQYRFLCEYSDIDLVGSGAEVFWEAHGKFRSPLWWDHIRDMYLVNNPFFHPTLMFRRGIVDRGIMRYDETFAADEDYELWGRLINQITTANMDCETIKYRIHGLNGQRHPRQLGHKKAALERFTKANNIYSAELVDALCEFQASGYVTPDQHAVLSEYARKALEYDHLPPKQIWPKLGWVQWAFAELPTYKAFMEWYTEAKGWRIPPAAG